MTTRLILVRHGQTSWNVEGRFMGSTDLPLTPLGKTQARAVARRLASEPVSVILTSPRLRARETALTIAAVHGLSPLDDERLVELDFGDWEGQLAAGVPGRWPAEWALWSAGASDDAAPPGGESLGSLRRRARAFLDAVGRLGQVDTAVAVTHGGFSHALLLEALGAPTSSFLSLAFGHCALSEIHLGPRGPRVQAMNDDCHLEARP